MKRFPFCFLLVFALALPPAAVFAQQPQEIDSMLTVLSRYEKVNKNRAADLRDSAKVELLFNLGRIYLNNNPDKSLQYTRQQLALAEKIGYKSGVADASNMLGTLYDKKGDYKTALQMFLRAVAIYDELGNYQMAGDVYNNIGVMYYGRGIYTEGLKYLLKGLETARRHNDAVGCLSAYNNIGLIYKSQNKNDLALEYYFKALELQLKRKGQFAISYTYLNIAELYRDKQPDKARKYSMLGLQSALREGDSVSIANNYAAIGNIDIDQRNYAKALESHSKAFSIRQRIGDGFGIFSSYVMLADIYQHTGQYAKALGYSTAAFKMVEQRGDLERLAAARKQLAEIQSAMGNYKDAYKNQQEFGRLNDSIFNMEVNKKLTEQRLNFDFKNLQEKKDQEAKAELARQKNIRNGIITGLGIIAIAIIVLLVRRHKRKNGALQNELTGKELEAQALRIENENIQLRNEIMELERKNEKKEKQILQKILELKQRELASSALYLYQKNELLSNLKSEVEGLPKNENVDKIKSIIQQNLFVDADWEKFRLHFEQVHPDFFKELEAKHPDLTAYELRLSVYIFMKLSNKEIAALLNIEPGSVIKAKVRLNKKLNLPQESE